MLRGLARILAEPTPMRLLLWRKLVRSLPRLFSFQTRLAARALDYPHYAYCLYHAAQLARKLGHEKVSVLELGVARGSGLLAIESHIRDIQREIELEFELYGFDTAEGLPEPADYRDFPSWVRVGRFAIDESELRGRGFSLARLVIGDIEETRRTFFRDFEPAPIACFLCDLVLYSSTSQALRIFEADAECFLPRVFCCFDDVVGSERELYSDYTGERLALREFNDIHPHQKIAQSYHLAARSPAEVWHWKIFVYHDFSHPRYGDFVG